MKILTVKLDDTFAEEVERFQQDHGYISKSEMVRDALRNLMVAERKSQLQANLRRYLEDKQAQMETADAVEARMFLTEEALKQVEANK
jgi:metal-responsive CopG/Arc/MetJ family transcriptional regulator